MPNLYYTNASGDNQLSTLSNWNTAADGSGDSPTNIPWSDDGSGGAWYGNYDLVDSTGGADAILSDDYSLNGSANCNLRIPAGNRGTINSGTFYGYVACGRINGGTFYGDIDANTNGIWGGTFYGNVSDCVIYDGVFLGNVNTFIIQGGLFSNYVFSGQINGGTFEVDRLSASTINYSAISLTQNGSPYTGPFGTVYYIEGEATTLDANGNGTWNGQEYEAGQVFVRPRNIVPRLNGRGSLGTDSLRWAAGHFANEIRVGGVPVIGLTSNNAIQVTIGANASANGTNLLSAYTAAKALTPNGSALSATNRAVVLLPPAVYTTTSGLTLDSQFVDIQGISTDASHVVIDRLTQTANDVRVSNATIATNGCFIASNLSLAVWTNCIASSGGWPHGGGFSGNNSMLGNSILSGTFINCTGSSSEYGGGFVGWFSNLSGTLINCTGSNSDSNGGVFAGFASNISGKLLGCSSQTNTGGLGPNAIGGIVINYINANGDIYDFYEEWQPN